MNLYFFGQIVFIGKTYIIFEKEHTGKIIYVANPEQFTKHTKTKLYVYEYENEYTKSTYGFESFKARVLFENLISISGIGPRTAINILKKGTNNIIEILTAQDANELAKCPSIGLKTANQIIFELKSKYVPKEQSGQKETNEQKTSNKLVFENVSSSLKILGFKKHQIDFALKTLEYDKSVEIMVERAIKIIANANFS